jgi:hypothetical protein
MHGALISQLTQAAPAIGSATFACASFATSTAAHAASLALRAISSFSDSAAFQWLAVAF